MSKFAITETPENIDALVAEAMKAEDTFRNSNGVETPAPSTTETSTSASILPSDSKSTNTTTPADETSDTLILGKFKDQAALEEAYKALESKLGKPPADATSKDGETPPDADKVAADAAKAAGVDLTSFSAEFEKTGDVSAEGRAAIAKALKGTFGDKAEAYVNMYVEGAKAKAVAAQTSYAQEVITSVGGQQTYDTLMKWGADNLSPEEITTFNSQVNSGNTSIAKLAMDNLNLRREALGGNTPSLMSASAKASTQDGNAYSSMEEVARDVNDPRYDREPDFRAKVEDKIKRSQGLSA